MVSSSTNVRGTSHKKGSMHMPLDVPSGQAAIGVQDPAIAAAFFGALFSSVMAVCALGPVEIPWSQTHEV